MPRIEHVTVTPVAFQDPPLLNQAGVHQPWCLRSIIEIEVEGRIIGLGETYGDELILHYLNAAAASLTGLDVWDLNGMRARVSAAVEAVYQPGNEASPRTSRNTLLPRIFAAFEVAALDAAARSVGVRVCDLLGGQVRASVPFSAYLFYKFEKHRFADYEPNDPWGEALTPEGVVAQARRMVELHGFGSLKLKGGVLGPEPEIEAMLALKDAFPNLPLRLDPNGLWHVHTSLKALGKLEGVLEYLEDPTTGIPAMALVQKAAKMPLATNMCVVSFPELPPAIAQGAVQVILSDHHFWGGLVASRDLARICEVWGLGLSMHSNSHLGISLMAMTHLAAATPNLTYACDTHYPWLLDDLVEGGMIPIEGGMVQLPDGPGLGITLDRAALARMNADYHRCGLRKRDDATEIRKYWPDWNNDRPRW